MHSGVCIEAFEVTMWRPDGWNHSRGEIVKETHEVDGTWLGEAMEKAVKDSSVCFCFCYIQFHDSQSRENRHFGGYQERQARYYLLFRRLVPLMGVGM